MFTTSVLCALSENMSCCVITGFRNRPQCEFQAYLESLNKQLVENNVTFDKNQGFPEFAEFTIVESCMETVAGEKMPEEEPPTVPQRHMSTKTSQVEDDDLYEQLDPSLQLPPPVDRSTKPPITTQMTAHTPRNESNTKPNYNNTARVQGVVQPLHCPDYTTRPLPPLPKGRRSQDKVKPVGMNEPLASELTKADKQTNDQNITEHEFLVRDMKINDVASALKSLKLEKYNLLFEASLVDGMALIQLTEDDFQREFGFTRIEAMRLRTFVRMGHVPK